MGSYQSERRQSERVPAQYDVRMLVSMAILDADLGSDDQQLLTLYGHTRDLSDSGFAVIVSSVTIDERACVEKYPLQVTLEFPDARVEIQAETVHCKPLNEPDAVNGYLIGAKLKQTSDEWLAAIKSLKSGQR